MRFCLCFVFCNRLPLPFTLCSYGGVVALWRHTHRIQSRLSLCSRIHHKAARNSVHRCLPASLSSRQGCRFPSIRYHCTLDGSEATGTPAITRHHVRRRINSIILVLSPSVAQWCTSIAQQCLVQSHSDTFYWSERVDDQAFSRKKTATSTTAIPTTADTGYE